MYNEKEIGQIIRKLRGNLSLREFGKLCDISHTTIDNLEKGFDFRTKKPTQVTINTLEKIAKATHVSVSFIIGEEQTKSFSSFYTNREIMLILSYRSKPDLQPIIDKILDIEENDTITIYDIALSEHKQLDEFIQMENSRWEEMDKTPSTDEDLL